MANYHLHKTEQGKLIECYHGAVNCLKSWSFWVGMTLGFPLEHLIWEKIWPFYQITKWIGL